MYTELYLVGVILLILSLLVAAARRRKRKIGFSLLAGAWIIAPIIALTWSERRTSAQTAACSITQITTGGASTAGINAAISDDGSRIALAVARNPTGGNPDLSQEIFLYNIGTGSFTQVTNSPGGFSGINRQVTISADGSRLAFLSNRNLTGGNADLNLEVFFYDSATAAITQITNTILNVPPGTGVNNAPTISGDGSHIAFISNSDFTGGNGSVHEQYFLYQITSGNFRQLTNSIGGQASAPGINFTGTEINFLHNGNLNGQNPDGNFELFRWNFQDGITHMTVTAGGGFESFTSPTMSSNGTRYAFSSVHNLNGTNPQGDHEIFLMNPTVGSFTAVTEGNASWNRKTYPDLSANGTHIAFQGDTRIVRYDIAANEFTTIPETFPGPAISGSRGPSISADGSRIAFYSDYNLTGGNPFTNNEIFLATCVTPTPTPTPHPLVVNQPDDAGDGICDGTCTLRDAVNAANTLPGNDTITFDASLTTVTLANEIAINGTNGSLHIKGHGADKLTIDGGPGLNRIFYSNFANVTISDITLTGGDGEGTPVTPGVVGTGGAIGANGGSLRLDRVHVTGNTAALIGGGINSQNGALRITNSTISGNSSNTCGGLTAGGVLSTLNVANATFSANTATLHGGGICSAGAANFRNVTITGNSADQGGGIRSTGQVSLGNTIIAGNTATTAYPEMDIQSGASFLSVGYNLVGDSTGDSTNTNTPVTYDATDIFDMPPMLIALGNYGGTTPTHPAQFGSPVIDGGAQGAAFDPFDGSSLLTDQRGNGFDRYLGNQVDIGAFEVQSDRTYVTQTADDSGACDQNCSLREAIDNVPVDGVVEFANGFTASTPIVVGSEILVDKDITISGPGADRLVISADFSNHRIFFVNTINLVSISGVTLTGGGAGEGGAIHVLGGNLRLDGVHIRNNGALRGGGVFFSQFGFNHTIRNSTFSENSANTGGGFYCEDPNGNSPTVVVLNSTFTLNSQGVNGPGFASAGCPVIVRNITVSGNTGVNNGGIFVTSGGTLNIGNSIVSGNTATTTDPQLLRPEISLFLGASATSAGNNLIGDSPGEAANTFIPIAYQPSDRLDMPPLLGSLLMNGGTVPTLAVLANSPAINAGDNAKALSPHPGFAPLLADQRGFERFIGPSPPTVDIGAFEFGAAASYSAATAVGSNVNVAAGPATVTFSGVTQAGTTTAVPIDQAAAGPLPTGFTFGPGLPIYDISTTAVFTAPVTVCLQVPAVITLADFNALIIFHYENGSLFNRTVSRNFATKTICASVNSLSPFAVAQLLAPSAAPVTVAGRVSSAEGRAIYGASVTLTDSSSGETFASRSNSFGYFAFDRVPAGRDYILNATAKRYSFGPRLLNVDQDISDADLTAEPGAGDRKQP